MELPRVPGARQGLQGGRCACESRPGGRGPPSCRDSEKGKRAGLGRGSKATLVSPTAQAWGLPSRHTLAGLPQMEK